MITAKLIDLKELHYTKEKIENLERLIENEGDFKLLVNYLWKTRAGLYHIIKTRKDLKENVSDQFHTINNIIDTLGSKYSCPTYRD